MPMLKSLFVHNLDSDWLAAQLPADQKPRKNNMLTTTIIIMGFLRNIGPITV